MKQLENYGNEIDLMKYRIEKARSDVKAANVLMGTDDYMGANNRSYYAIFHAISAVHALEGQSYRKHKDTIANFNKEYVKTEVFPRKIGRRIARAEEIRHASDYDDFYIAFMKRFSFMKEAMSGQDLVYVSNVDITPNSCITKNVIEAMKENGVKRLISSNAVGIYNEVPGSFGRANRDACDYVWTELLNSEKLVSESEIDYTIIRLPWLTDGEKSNYTVTTRHQTFYGDYISRKNVADLILRIIDNPQYGSRDSLAIG